MVDPTEDELEYRRQVGTRLRDARESAGMSLRTVAERFEMSHSAIGHWETGHNPIDLSRLYQLAKLYDTQVASFLIDFVDKAVLAALVTAALADMGGTAKTKPKKQSRRTA